MEEKIIEAEIEQNSELGNETIQDVELERSKKINARIEFALIFILGILLGIAIKTEAVRKITIGFDDYKMKIAAQDYNINKLQEDIAKKASADLEDSTNAQPQASEEESAPTSGNDSRN